MYTYHNFFIYTPIPTYNGGTYLHTMELYSAIKKNEIMPFAAL